jgi:ATP-dependent Clp protease ATP-binding subunit ClpA
VNEPSVEDSVKILKGLKPYYEEAPQAELHQRRDQSRRWNCRPSYINDRKLPDKAIDVIDEAGAGQTCCPRASARRPSA